MNVNEYRRRNPRCRTCEHAKEAHRSTWPYDGWRCTAKNRFYAEDLGYTKLRGLFCALYKPKEVNE